MVPNEVTLKNREYVCVIELGHKQWTFKLVLKLNTVFLFPYPIGSMYGIFTYIYHENQPNVGEYTIHGSYGYRKGNHELWTRRGHQDAWIATQDHICKIFYHGNPKTSCTRMHTSPEQNTLKQKRLKNQRLLPWEPHVSFIFRGYDPYFEGIKPSFFHGFLGSKGK